MRSAPDRALLTCAGAVPSCASSARSIRPSRTRTQPSALEPMLLDRHLIYCLLNQTAAALDDLNLILKHNKHAAAYRSRSVHAENIAASKGNAKNLLLYVCCNFSCIRQTPFFYRAAIHKEKNEVTMAIVNFTYAIKHNPDYDSYF